MITEHYEYIAFEDKPIYYFESEGKQGKIPKLILFTPLDKNLWNLGFGDLKEEYVNDSVISNNHDIVKIMGTLAKIVYAFLDENPSSSIRIKPVDEKRGRLYNHIFRRNYEAINNSFDIVGIIKRRKEAYRPEKIYEYFELKRKFV
jgi:hypothetical protein